MAAIAAAVAVAPAAQADAAPEQPTLTFTGPLDTGYYMVPDAPMPAEAFLEDNGVPRFSIAPGSVQVVHGRIVPLTFEAMAADCRALGCQLVPSPIGSHEALRIITHVDAGGRWRGYDYSADNAENVLARVDAWRRSLHEQAGTTEPVAHLSGTVGYGPDTRLTRLT